MASKISGLNGTSASVGAGSRAGKARDASSGDATASGSTDPADVQITSSASLLASLEQQLSSMPAVNEQRVAQFRTAIENGTYTVHPQHVADQLMQIEHSLAQITGG